MKKHFTNFKVVKKKTSKKNAEVDCRAIKPPSYHFRESKKVSSLDGEKAQSRLPFG